MYKAYMGDSVYAEWDGYSLELTTRNGLPNDPSNKIAIDLDVWLRLVKWMLARPGMDAQREPAALTDDGRAQ